jgi:hypothetical protein
MPLSDPGAAFPAGSAAAPSAGFSSSPATAQAARLRRPVA